MSGCLTQDGDYNMALGKNDSLLGARRLAGRSPLSLDFGSGATDQSFIPPTVFPDEQVPSITPGEVDAQTDLITGILDQAQIDRGELPALASKEGAANRVQQFSGKGIVDFINDPETFIDENASNIVAMKEALDEEGKAIGRKNIIVTPLSQALTPEIDKQGSFQTPENPILRQLVKAQGNTNVFGSQLGEFANSEAGSRLFADIGQALAPQGSTLQKFGDFSVQQARQRSSDFLMSELMAGKSLGEIDQDRLGGLHPDELRDEAFQFGQSQAQAQGLRSGDLDIKAKERAAKVPITKLVGNQLVNIETGEPMFTAGMSPQDTVKASMEMQKLHASIVDPVEKKALSQAMAGMKIEFGSELIQNPDGTISSQLGAPTGKMLRTLRDSVIQNLWNTGNKDVLGQDLWNMYANIPPSETYPPILSNPETGEPIVGQEVDGSNGKQFSYNGKIITWSGSKWEEVK
jgi:hypothetical protein